MQAGFDMALKRDRDSRSWILSNGDSGLAESSIRRVRMSIVRIAEFVGM